MSLLSRAVVGKVTKVTTRQAFAGAVTSRLNDFVFSSIQSANQETRFEASVLRGRARELARNNPNAKRFLRLLEQNVVGPKGIRLESQVLLKTGKNAGMPDVVANDAIEGAWRDWGRKGNCDVTRRHTWTSFCQLVVATIARDGEAFVRMIDGFPNAYGFAVQLLDADQVDPTFTVAGGPGQNRVEQGVELDQWGGAVAFHVWSQHPADGTQKVRERLAAKDILHLYRVEREGQARGITWFAPVTIAMRMLDGYSEAELVAARTAAAKMGFVIQSEDAEGPDPDAPADSGTQTMEAAPGVIDRLAHGETFQNWDPTHPAGNFEPFVLAQQRLLAMGLNVSHMSLTGDLRQANYSSARVGLLDERDGWRILQTFLVDGLCEPVYRRWLRIAALSTRLTLPSYDLTKYEDVAWRPRGWDWVDPAKDLAANADAVAQGFKSRTEICAESGREHADVLLEIARENAEAAAAGLTLQVGSSAAPAAPNATPNDMPTDGTDATDGTIATAMPRRRLNVI